MNDHPNTSNHRTQPASRQRPVQGRQGNDRETAPAVPRIEHDRSQGPLIIRVSGTLRFPTAIELTHAVESLLSEGVTEVTVLDLGDLDDLDHTGIALLVAAGRDLKAAGSQVRVVTSDPALRQRLPYTLGLRRTFSSLPEALSFQD